MKPLSELFERLVQLDIKLSINDGKLRVNAPNSALTENLRNELTERKEEILRFLSQKKSISINRPERSIANHDDHPLSLSQERIWSLARINKSSSRYNMPLIFEIKGSLDIESLQRSFDEMQQRHSIMRAAFVGDNLSDVIQRVQSENPFCLVVTDIFLDLLHLNKAQASSQLKILLEEEVRRPFDITIAPLWRMHLFRLDKKNHVLAFVAHHLIFDGISQSIFIRELSEYYRAFSEGKDLVMPAPAFEFFDFAIWQRKNFDSLTLQSQRDYWLTHLSGKLYALKVPNDKPRLLNNGFTTAKNFEFNRLVTEKLFDLGRVVGTTPYVMLMTVFFITMNRFTEQDDLVVCSPTSGRDNVDLENVIGYFNNLVVMHLRCSSDPRLKDIISAVRQISLAALDHQNVPIQEIAQFPNLVRTTLTRAMFSFQKAGMRKLDLANLKISTISIRKDSSDFELAMYAQEFEGAINGVLEFNSELFSEEAIVEFLSAFEGVAKFIGKNADARLSTFPKYGKNALFVEDILNGHPQVEKAIVITNKPSGDLFAYLVLDEDNIPTLELIRLFLKKLLADYLIPSCFIPIDKIPLLGDGNIDFAALPQPINRRQSLVAYSPPRSDLEEKLCLIWKQVLWLDCDVGIYDNFRELGGHSLLFVQLILRIEKELQYEVPLKIFATLNTISSMAEALEGFRDDPSRYSESLTHAPGLSKDIYQGLRTYTMSWEGKRHSSDSVIVGLNILGSKQNLFWCLQREYELSQLSRYLGDDQPVYGMRSGNKIMIKTQDNIEKLATYYINEILQIQPQGPFLIGGNCQAAKIAFEIAVQLKELGHKITVLFLHEKFIPKYYNDPVVITFGLESDRNPFLRFHEPLNAWSKFYKGPIFNKLVSGGHGDFFQEPNVQVLTNLIEKKITEAQKCEFIEWENPDRSDSGSFISLNTYRASIKGPNDFNVKALETINLSIQIRNISTNPWPAYDISGIYIGNHWLNSRGDVIEFLDGRTKLTSLVEPGSIIDLILAVKAPAKSGRWLLEIDLVQEGVTWFKEQGSKTLLVNVNVENEQSKIMNFLKGT